MENSEIREGFVGADQSEEVLFTLKTRLKSMVGWARLCALGSLVGIIFFLIIALLVLFLGQYLLSFVSPQAMAAMPFPIYFYGFFYLFTGAIQLVPTLSLLKFSSNARKWLKSDDVTLLDKSLAGLSRLFIFYGIVTALSLLFVAIGFLVGGVASIVAI